MNVLVLAYSCGPNRGSEPGVGWNWVLQIARRNRTTVLTTREFYCEIQMELLKNPKRQIRFYYTDFPIRAKFAALGTFGIRMHYLLWQSLALFKILRLHRKQQFDLAHHLTFGINYLPSILCLVPIPFIWGPLGGGEMIRKELLGELSWKGRMNEGIRKSIQRIYPWIPINYFALRRAALLLVRTTDTLGTIPKSLRGKARVVPESAMPIFGGGRAMKSGAERRPERIISVGCLIEAKGLALGIRAFGKLSKKYSNIHLTVVGEGPERERLERMSADLKLGGRVFFTGGMKRPEVLSLMRLSDILLHPSLRDGAAWPILEALSFGLPVVCLNTSGPSLIVNKECGIKINPMNFAQIIADLEAALERLISHQDLYSMLSKGSLARIRGYFSWENVGQKIEYFYEIAKAGEYASYPR